MFYKKYYTILSERIFKCVKEVFNTVKKENVYDASDEQFDNGEGVSCNICGIKIANVELEGFFNVDEKEIFVSLFIDNNTEKTIKTNTIKQYCKSSLNKTWTIDHSDADGDFIMLVYNEKYTNIDEAFEELKIALEALKTNSQQIKNLHQMKEKERINLNSLKYTWTDARDIIELGDKDSRLKITKNGSLKIYINNKEVKINIDKLSGIIGVEPKLFKSGFITFDYDNDKYEPIIISISKKSKKDYEIVRKLLEEAFKSFDIIVGL